MNIVDTCKAALKFIILEVGSVLFKVINDFDFLKTVKQKVARPIMYIQNVFIKATSIQSFKIK